MTPRWARPIWDPDPPAAASNQMRAPRTSTIVDGRPLGRGLLISIQGDAAASKEPQERKRPRGHRTRTRKNGAIPTPSARLRRSTAGEPLSIDAIEKGEAAGNQARTLGSPLLLGGRPVVYLWPSGDPSPYPGPEIREQHFAMDPRISSALFVQQIDPAFERIQPERAAPPGSGNPCTGLQIQDTRVTWTSRSRGLQSEHPSRPGSVGIESQRRWCDPGRVPGRRAPHRRPPRGRRPRERSPEPDPPGPDTRRVSAGPVPRTRR